MSQGKDSFERFYMNKIALGEGCGCAEMIVTTHELDRQAGAARYARARRSGYLARLRAGVSATVIRARAVLGSVGSR